MVGAEGLRAADIRVRLYSFPLCSVNAPTASTWFRASWRQLVADTPTILLSIATGPAPGCLARWS